MIELAIAGYVLGMFLTLVMIFAIIPEWERAEAWARIVVFAVLWPIFWVSLLAALVVHVWRKV